MDSERYLKVSELERAGKLEEGLSLLRALASENDPLALVELGSRHITTEGYSPSILPIVSEPEKGKKLIERGKRVLEEWASKGDGEAMRMLGYFYLGHLCPCEKDIQKAETLLLNAFQAGCYFAANDLHTFYLGSNINKSKHYYKEAERHKCRVVFHEDFET
jgi:TPR repeat protein